MRKVLFFIAVVLCTIKLSAQSYYSIEIISSPQRCKGGTAKIQVSGGQAPYSFNWNTGQNGNFVSNLTAGIYVVTIIDNVGKDSSISFEIPLEPCLVTIPESLSPNDDGISDTWTIGNIENYPNFSVEIFDRWGQRVHKQEKEFKSWDGKNHGIKLPAATYYYIFFYDGKNGASEKGSLTIMY